MTETYQYNALVVWQQQGVVEMMTYVHPKKRESAHEPKNLSTYRNFS